MSAWLPQVDSSVVLDGLTSLLLLLFLLIVRALIVRAISKNPTLSMEAKRRWVVSVRNSIVFVLLVGLVVIWTHELQAFAVSLVALAAALVLATKELLLCWSGAALRVGGKVYSVGDLKKSCSSVLAARRGSTYRSEPLTSSLAAALPDSLFEHSAWCSPVVLDVRSSEILTCHMSFPQPAISS